MALADGGFGEAFNPPALTQNQIARDNEIESELQETMQEEHIREQIERGRVGDAVSGTGLGRVCRRHVADMSPRHDFVTEFASTSQYRRHLGESVMSATTTLRTYRVLSTHLIPYTYAKW